LERKENKMAKGDGQQMPNALAGAGMNPQVSGMNRFGGLLPMLAQYGQMMGGQAAGVPAGGGIAGGGGAASSQPMAGGPNYIGPSQQGMSQMLGMIGNMGPRPDMGLGNVGQDQLQQQPVSRAPNAYGNQSFSSGPSNDMMQAMQGLRRRPMMGNQRPPMMGNQGPRRELD
jgi:hypothetical protein